MASRIEYSEKYMDDNHEYRHVILPKEALARHRSGVRATGRNGPGCGLWDVGGSPPLPYALVDPTPLSFLSHPLQELARSLPKQRLLTESEWRGIGVQQSRGWQHYAIHRPEPHILLFRRPLGTDPVTGKVNAELEREAKEKYAESMNGAVQRK
ncbi:cyclin-dependent kinase regulatory subunit CKS1 [Nannochloropsis gaditana CCMP526]|uniref:cyclin-dependent kinase regulatory subunit CKS1 n=1 Tax=Nannochloropsis gaditana (strain CCMP526) TaxID=1093141 RepID=UPI00029F623D|nr:cyclin-dependent kinase regulatory subunit CKS1 [Nannochloropsis gaditana CCMP526]EKU21163.1 cyclin-dependent kinase regulatory subunit CKS1 [Nannochloropsis gaditana CCMP526]|eukprot:XP_005855194.1 cyclin-dependent kinase regulatory subunit CKS1 [Nannochloropsis gaditana CCMP526]